jgi:hypothetical protein
MKEQSGVKFMEDDGHCMRSHLLQNNDETIVNMLQLNVLCIESDLRWSTIT